MAKSKHECSGTVYGCEEHVLSFCAMKNSGLNPTLTASDASAILDTGPTTKHFSSSFPPFELGAGSPPNRWLAVSEPGARSFCVCFVFVPKFSKGK